MTFLDPTIGCEPLGVYYPIELKWQRTIKFSRTGTLPVFPDHPTMILFAATTFSPSTPQRAVAQTTSGENIQNDEENQGESQEVQNGRRGKPFICGDCLVEAVRLRMLIEGIALSNEDDLMDDERQVHEQKIRATVETETNKLVKQRHRMCTVTKKFDDPKLQFLDQFLKEDGFKASMTSWRSLSRLASLTRESFVRRARRPSVTPRRPGCYVTLSSTSRRTRLRKMCLRRRRALAMADRRSPHWLAGGRRCNQGSSGELGACFLDERV
jgi:hypothetical protein